jgi:hypothetical protein
MAETARDSANPPAAPVLATSAAGRRNIQDRSSEPPSVRANWIVTSTHFALAALKWVAVGIGLVTMLVIVPLADLVGGSLSSVGRLLGGAPASRR